MKILFAYPGIANIGFNAFQNRRDSVDSWYIPIGLCYLASAALKEGHKIDLMDLRYMSGYEEVEDKIVSSNCGLVAISYQTPGAKYAMEVAKISRKHNKITVGGGIHPTIMPNELLDSGLFDHVIVGEGIISFPELVNDLEKGVKPKLLIIGKYVDNLDSVSFPHYFDLYVDSVIKEHKLVMMFTSRGCPGQCEFCQPVANKLFGKKVKFRSADNILMEALEWKSKYDINRFMIVDDTFLVRKKLVKEFCRKLIDSKSGLVWTCNARANEFEEEMIQLMAKSGCTGICIGFESGSQRILDITKKGTTVEQGYRAAELCNKYGIGFTTNILVGVPSETEEDYKLNLEFVKKVKARHISYNWLVPYPGTETYEYCKKNNLLYPDIPWEGYEMNKIKERGLISIVDYDLVREWEERIIHWDRKIPAKYHLIEEGKLLEKEGSIDKAIKKYTAFTKTNPDFFDGYYWSGKAYKKLKEYSLSLQNLKRAKFIFESANINDNNLRTSIQFHLGEVFYKLGQKEPAKKELESCTNLNPNHKKANEYLDLLGAAENHHQL